MSTKISLKSYLEPTPKLFRKIGDSLLGVTVFLLANPDLLGSKYTRYVTICMIVAKFITNFFTDDEQPSQTT